MKRIFVLLAACALFTACGNSPTEKMEGYLNEFEKAIEAKDMAKLNSIMSEVGEWQKTLSEEENEEVEAVAAKWNDIEVVSVERDSNVDAGNINAGNKYEITFKVDEKGLDDAVGIELVTLATDKDGRDYVFSVQPLDVVKREGNIFTFHTEYVMNNAGSFRICYRMYPKHEELPHRQDFAYVKWLA